MEWPAGRAGCSRARFGIGLGSVWGSKEICFRNQTGGLWDIVELETRGPGCPRFEPDDTVEEFVEK